MVSSLVASVYLLLASKDITPVCLWRLAGMLSSQEDLKRHANVTVACVDGRDIAGLVTLLHDPMAIFIAIGGDARLDHVALQLRLCLLAFRPGLIVVRSIELATLISLIGGVEPPKTTGVSFWGSHFSGPAAVPALLYLSHSSRAHLKIKHPLTES
jgi:hypothetical protein